MVSRLVACVAPRPNASGDHIAGLDGLRGVAVAFVVIYHAFPGFLPGGYVGVSVFFALSGFLITHRLLTEHRRTGTIAVGAFAVARARRLLPASLFTVAVVAVVWSAAGWMTPDTARSARWAVLQAANWDQVSAGVRYGADTALAPLAHFWSLSVEEQIFWLFPLFVAAFVSAHRRLVAAVAVLLAVSLAATFAASDPTVVYYATYTRAAEFLAGALAACAVHTRRIVPRPVVASAVASVAFAALVWFAFRVEVGDPVVAAGALAVTGAVAAVAVAATALSGRGRTVASLLDARPLAWAGTRSYGIYLYHWPILVALRQLEVSNVALIALPATLALAEMSFIFLESPFRRSVTRPVRWLAGSTVAALVLVAVVPVSPSAAIDFDAAVRALSTVPAAPLPERDAPSTTDAGTSRVGVSRPAPPPTAAPSTTVFGEPVSEPTSPVPAVEQPVGSLDAFIVGDSKAVTLALSAAWSDLGDLRVVGSFANLGCPVGRGGRVRFTSQEPSYRVADVCDWTGPLPDQVAAAEASVGVDVAVVYFGTWDVALRKVPALGDVWLSTADEQYAVWLYAEMKALNAALVAAGADQVVWLTLTDDRRTGDAQHVARFNVLVDQIAADEPSASVVDLAGWIAAQPDRAELLPDNIHTTWEPDGGTGAAVLERFLAPAIVAAARTGTP